MKVKVNNTIKKEHFREILVSVNDSGDYVLNIYYILKRTTKTKIYYSLIYKSQWIVKKNGVMYNIFKKQLSDFYNKPESIALKNLGIIRC
jgi:hypothetical protein